MNGSVGSAGPAQAREPVSELAPLGVHAFVTTRSAGDFALGDDGTAAAGTAQWNALAGSIAPGIDGLVSARQVHGQRIAEHREAAKGWQRLDGYDAHIVHARGVAAAVTVADCVPVFVAHPDGTVAMVHAGWRGVAARILPGAVALLHATGRSPGDLHVHLGPAICGRCYEVGPDVYEQLTGWQTTRPRLVDLRSLLAEQARESGVRAMSASPWCTRCDNDRFFSHRAGDTGRQVAVIGTARIGAS